MKNGLAGIAFWLGGVVGELVFINSIFDAGCELLIKL